MGENHTTAAVQRYLDAPAEETPGDPLIRAPLDRAVGRLEMLCGTMLFRSHPRPRRPPLNLQTDEVLGPVAERLLRTLRAVRPLTVRAFFALVNRHVRRELNDLARRLSNSAEIIGHGSRDPLENRLFSSILIPTSLPSLPSVRIRILEQKATKATKRMSLTRQLRRS